mgnify:CR=1 FL=1
MSYIYYSKFHIGQKVVPKLSPNCGAVGVVIQIYIIDEHSVSYMVAWNNGINKEATHHEITPKRKNDGVTTN